MKLGLCLAFLYHNLILFLPFTLLHRLRVIHVHHLATVVIFKSILVAVFKGLTAESVKHVLPECGPLDISDEEAYFRISSHMKKRMQV